MEQVRRLPYGRGAASAARSDAATAATFLRICRGTADASEPDRVVVEAQQHVSLWKRSLKKPTDCELDGAVGSLHRVYRAGHLVIL
jgi:hypothetical protein